MVELGPYVYTEKITKTNVAHSNNDEVLEYDVVSHIKNLSNYIF